MTIAFQSKKLEKLFESIHHVDGGSIEELKAYVKKLETFAGMHIGAKDWADAHDKSFDEVVDMALKWHRIK